MVEITPTRCLFAFGSIAAAAAIASTACSTGPSPDVCQVPPGKVAIVIRLDGADLPEGEFIAPPITPNESPRKGLQLDVMPPGYHPTIRSSNYRWELVDHVSVPPDRVGILVRNYGEELPEGQIFADENPEDAAQGILRKGILSRPLLPGTHFINLRAYDVIIAPRVTLGPGQVGVVTRLHGKAPVDPDGWIAAAGERGVQIAPLPPGAHYVNPYVEHVMPLSRESQRIDLKSPGRRVRSPTLDGFDVALNGTLEWSVPEEKAPLVFSRYGDLDRIQDVLLMPATRAVSRQQGVRTAVRDFLSSAKLLAFQNALQSDLETLVENEGLEIHGLTVSGVEPPAALAEVIQFREAASLSREQYVSEMKKAESMFSLLRAQVAEQRPEAVNKEKKSVLEKMAQVVKERAEFDIARQAAIDRLGTDRSRALIDAAEILRKADLEAAAIVGAAELEVAAIAPLIAAHGSGNAYARSLLIERLVPRLGAVTADIDGPLGSMLSALAATGKAVSTTSNPEQNP
jgi:SPFH domain / Band 7 family